MNTPTDKVTIHDVAKAAGVSVSTVSRVLNNKDDVAPATQTRVQQIIDELGYASNLAARSMRSRKTNLLGLIMPDVADPYSIEVMKGVNEAIKQHDYDLLIYTNGDIKKTTSAAREQYYVSLLNSGVTDGVVVVAPVASEFNTAAPLVVIDPNTDSPDYPAVLGTNREGAMSAMSHLLELGHTRIGFLGGRPDIQSANRRLKGYQDSLAQAGLPLDPRLVTVGDFTSETAKEKNAWAIKLTKRPTAIFASNDQSARGVMQAAAEKGLRVPEDLSVIGFDNIPESEIWTPALTTVDQFVSEMGYTAINMLITLVEGKPLEQPVHKTATKLIIRNSCQTL